jgi:hypothetical protein
VSGYLVCRDFDTAEAYLTWASEHRDLAKSLPTVRTGRGYHVYFRSRECTKIKNLGDGELRGNGYCLLPPSRHPSGGTYEWVVPLNGTVPEVNPFATALAVS